MSARFSPPKDHESHALSIIRTPAKGEIKCVVLSRRWIWIPVHYNGRRTVICPDIDSCEWCPRQIQSWKGFAIVRALNGVARSVLSITPNVEPALARELANGGDSSGLICRFYRLGNERNSPLAISILGRKDGEPSLDVMETVRNVERIFRAKVDTFILCNKDDAGCKKPEVQVKRVP